MKINGLYGCICWWAGIVLLLGPGILSGQRMAYLPDSTFNPINLRVNLIILQREDGSGNFQDTPADQVFLENMIRVTNTVFAKITNRNAEYYPNQILPFLPDAKVRIVANTLFIRDETGWNNRNDHNFAGVPNLSGWYLDSLDRAIYANDSLPQAINLFFSNDGQLYEQMVVQQTTTEYNKLVFFKQHASSEIPSLQTQDYYYGKYHPLRSHIGNVWLKLWWKRNILKEPDWTMEEEVGKSIAHELGHLLGLSHTPDTQTHALMRTKFGGLRDYISAQEIARIHQTFALYPSLWQYVGSDFTYGGPNADWAITGQQQWKENRRLYGNLIVKSGASLVIRNEVLLPANGIIIVEPGALLTLENGTIRRVNTPSPDTFVWSNGRETRDSPYRLKASDQGTNGGILLRGNAWIEWAVLQQDH